MAPSALALTHGEAHYHEAEHALGLVVAANPVATDQHHPETAPSHHDSHGHLRVDVATKPNLVLSPTPHGELLTVPPSPHTADVRAALRDVATLVDAPTAPRPPDPLGTPLRSPRPPPLG